MKKVLKRIAAVCMAAVMMATVLCTYAFARGTIEAYPTGPQGDRTIKYTYSVNEKWTEAQMDFVTGASSGYSGSITPVSGTGAQIRFYNISTTDYDYTILVPKYMSGMPGSLDVRVTLKPNTRYIVEIKSDSSTIADGSFTIRGVYKEIEN